MRPEEPRERSPEPCAAVLREVRDSPVEIPSVRLRVRGFVQQHDLGGEDRKPRRRYEPHSSAREHDAPVAPEPKLFRIDLIQEHLDERWAVQLVAAPHPVEREVQPLAVKPWRERSAGPLLEPPPAPLEVLPHRPLVGPRNRDVDVLVLAGHTIKVEVECPPAADVPGALQLGKQRAYPLRIRTLHLPALAKR